MADTNSSRQVKLLAKRLKIQAKREVEAQKRKADLLKKAEYNKKRVKKSETNTNTTLCQSTEIIIPSESEGYSLRKGNIGVNSLTTDDTAQQSKSVSKSISAISNNVELSVPAESIEKVEDLNDEITFVNYSVNNNKKFSKQQKKINNIRKREAKLRRTINKLQEVIKKKNNLVSKWKNKYFRLLRKGQKPDEILNSVKKVEKAGLHEVRKNLLEYEVLKKQIRDRQLLLTNERERSIFTQCLAGRVVKKYQAMRKISPFVSNYSMRKYRDSKNIKFIRSTAKKSMSKDKIVQRVEKFLEKSENTSIAPGVQDTITKNGVKKRKRYLCDSMDNLYLKFKEEEKLKISRSLFYAVKPFWVLHKKITGRDTCLCKPHANMGLLLQRLFQLKTLSSPSITSFVKSRVCDMFSKECFFGNCKKCQKKSILSISSEEPTWYYKWSTQEVSRPGSKGRTYNVKITSKVKIQCTVNELISEINSQIPEFLKHVYLTTHQFKAIEAINNNLKDNEVYLVIDFSENYICKNHQEIQSAHFGASKKQLSLHTRAFFYIDKSTNLKTCKSFCSISECLRHDAASVWAHLDPVFKLIKDTVPNVTTVHIQSDGPSTQYKNKTNFFLFKKHCCNEQFDYATYNITSPGHGKSVADAIGGSAKGVCDRIVAQGSDICSAEDMVNAINSSNSKIQAFVISQSDIESIDSKIPASLKPAPNTKKIFQLIWCKSARDKLFLNQFSCSYCIANKLYNPSCSHFQLQPNSWTFEDKKSQKRSAVTNKNSLSKKKKVDSQLDTNQIFDPKRKTKRQNKNETSLNSSAPKKRIAPKNENNAKKDKKVTKRTKKITFVDKKNNKNSQEKIPKRLSRKKKC